MKSRSTSKHRNIYHLLVDSHRPCICLASCRTLFYKDRNLWFQSPAAAIFKKLYHLTDVLRVRVVPHGCSVAQPKTAFQFERLSKAHISEFLLKAFLFLSPPVKTKPGLEAITTATTPPKRKERFCKPSENVSQRISSNYIKQALSFFLKHFISEIYPNFSRRRLIKLQNEGKFYFTFPSLFHRQSSYFMLTVFLVPRIRRRL